MRPRKEKLIVTFRTTVDAMSMEQYCREHNVPGRLVPTPGEISAGCGLAWCAELCDRDAVAAALAAAGIPAEQIGTSLMR